MDSINFFENTSEYDISKKIYEMLFLSSNFTSSLICTEEFQYLCSIDDTYIQETLLLESQEKTYKNYKIKALRRLRSLLDYRYNLVDCTNNRLAQCLPTKLKFQNSIVEPVALNMSANNQTRSVEKHLVVFFNWLKRNTNIKSEVIASNERDYVNRYVSYLDWILASLYFIYYDGRIFNGIDPNDLPRFKIKFSCSPFSFKLALKQTLILFKEIIPELHKNKNFTFAMVQLHIIDNEFKFFKINRMCLQREKFLSDQNINTIIDLFPMKPHKALNLKSTFDKYIFKNENIIDLCLNSTCRDPFYMFNCFFMTSLKYINERLKYDTDFKLPEETTIDDLILTIQMRMINLLSEVYTSKSNNNESFDDNKINFHFWKEYYFGDRDKLNIYVSSTTTRENDYMTFLFDKVINSLPKHEKKAK